MKDSNDQESKWVHDSSVDYKGNIPVRASTGAWRAAIFIIVIEFSERVAYFGISSNLIIYLTKVLHQDLKTAATNVNYWGGATTVLPLLGAFLADAYFGRFFMILLSSIIYLMGLSLLTMSEFIPILKPCKNLENKCGHDPKVHEVVFFIALYFLAVGAGGHKPNLESFGADQFDENHLEEKKQRMSFFNWWNFVLFAGVLLSTTLIVYLEDHFGWGVAISIPTLMMAISLLMFCFGKPFYRYRAPQGSPLKPIFQVLIAALSKRNLQLPSSPDMLYEIEESKNVHGRLLYHTNSLRFLDKAAIVECNDIQQLESKRIGKKRLATVTMVEETKLVINLIPIWLNSVMFAVGVAQVTFFIKQSSTMNRKIGNRFEIPPASVATVGVITLLLTVTFYERILIPVLRRVRGHDRGLKILERIGIGMTFPILGMAVAALVEKKRLTTAEQGNIRGHSVPMMSVFWLAPQFIISAIGESLVFVGLQEFFYEQVPESMRSLGMAFYFSAIGVGEFVTSFLISITAQITGKLGSSWIGKDLNSSRLDKFFWLITILSAVNLFTYVFFAKRHSYKKVKNVMVADGLEGECVLAMT